MPSPSPLAGEGKLSRSDSRERGRQISKLRNRAKEMRSGCDLTRNHPDDIIGLVRFPHLMQPVMDILHEGMEMSAPLGLDRGAREEAIHEHRLAAADAAPQIETAGRRSISVFQKLGEHSILARPISFERSRQLLKPADDHRLCRVLLQISRLESVLIIRPNAHCAALIARLSR